MLLPVLLLLASCRLAGGVAPPPPPGSLDAPSCASALDCSLGGACVGGACACRAEWSGARCSSLALAPSPRWRAFDFPTATSTWGGSVARVGAGSYWMAAALMEGNCGLSSWESNSAIALLNASAPAGPYARVAVLLPPFAHNPTLHALPDGGLVVYHIGSGVAEHPFISNCSNGTTPLPPAARPAGAAPPLRLGTPGAPLPAPNALYLPAGSDPGTASAWQTVPSTGGDWAMNNPAAHIDAASGAVTLVYKTSCNASVCPPATCAFCRQFGIATAPGWRGPFTDAGVIQVFGEDAYIWRDPADAPGGGWHILFQGGSYTPALPAYPSHWNVAFSLNASDASSWLVALTGNGSMPADIALAAGGEQKLTRRERHQLLFDDATGAPAWLFNGAEWLPGSDMSTTVVQPIGGAAGAGAGA